MDSMPTVLIRYLGLFLENDMESFSNFSLTNKRYFQLFSHIFHFQSFLKKNLPKNQKTILFKNENKNPILHFYLKTTNEMKLSFQTIKYLIEKKSDLNVMYQINYSNRNSPLHLACMNEKIQLELIKSLFENKTDYNLANREENTPLHLACLNKNVSFGIIKHLVNNKCDVNSKNKYLNNPLHLSLFNENISLEIIKYLVDNKCNLNLMNNKKYTPLHIAYKRENNSTEIIKFLIISKSDLNLKDKHNKTPLQLGKNSSSFKKKTKK
jgi:ankyrin repeat protein